MASKRLPLNTVIWLSVVILLVGFVLRLLNLMVLPLFVDEATHIRYAQFQILENNPFFGAQNSKWLYLAVVRLLNPLDPSAPWIARYISVLSSIVTVACCIALGRILDRPVTGLLAGVFYIVLPLALWHERQALIDPMLAAFTAMVLLVSVRLVLKPRVWMAALLALVLIGAFATKTSGLPFFAVPAAAAVLLSKRSPNWKQALLYTSIATVIGVLGIVAFDHLKAMFGAASYGSHSASVSNLLIFDLADSASRETLQRNFADYLETLWLYIGPVLLLLSALSLVWAAMGKRRWEVLFLLVGAFALAALPVMARPVTGSGWQPPRYYLVNAAPLVVLAALSLRLLVKRLPENVSLLGGLVLAGTVVAPSLATGWTYITAPQNAKLTTVDEDNYHRFSSGYGRAAAIEELLALHRHNTEVRLNVIGRGYDMIWFQGYLGPAVGTYETLELEGEEGNAQRGRVANWLLAGDRVFYLEEDERTPIPEHPHDADIRQIGEYDYRERTYRLYEVEQAGGLLAEDIYTRLGRDPQFMTDDYQSLAARIQQGDSETPVIVYPFTHAPLLAARIPNPIEPLPLYSWPFDAQMAGQAVSEVGPPASGEVVNVVLSNPAESDAQRLVQLALAEQLYILGEPEFFGLLSLQRYVTGSSGEALSEVSGLYEGVISLKAGGIVGGSPQPGEPLLIGLEWQTSEPIQDSFVVFTHIVDAGGNLIAQRDAVPGRGLLPMPSWAVGAAVRDQFAIMLPDEIQPGEYQVWIGMYHPESGLRLGVSEAPEHGPDYIILARFTIEQ